MRRRLDATRSSLSSWRERVAKRVEEVERKREVLSSDASRRAANAPTRRLDELDPRRAPTARLATVPEKPLPVSESEPADATDWVDPIADGFNPLLVTDQTLEAIEQDDIDGAEQEPISPSVVHRAAGLLLDLIVLLLVPAVAISVAVWPVAMRLELSYLWTTYAAWLGPFFLGLFVALETLYVGAFGRTPGQRLLGLRIVDRYGETPTFGSALLRALLFPVLFIPPTELAVGTRTVVEG